MSSAITTAITDVMDTGSGERGSPIRFSRLELCDNWCNVGHGLVFP